MRHARHVCDEPTCMEPAGKDDAHRCGGDMTVRHGCGEWFCGMHLIFVPDNPPLCIRCYLDGVSARARKLYAPSAPAAAA